MIAWPAILLSAQSRPAFEVASIKPSASDSHTETRRYPGGRFTATGVTLFALIQRAYDVKEFQIVGGPKWIHSDRYDVTAKASAVDAEQSVTPMIQSLLADRFQLKLHEETREMARYALVVDRGGPKLHPDTKGGGSTWSYKQGYLTGKHVSMEMFAIDLLQKALERPVVDETGIPGAFDVDLKWAAEETPPGSGSDSAGPSIFTAIREQLGLRLSPGRGSVEVIVIESVEKPAAN